MKLLYAIIRDADSEGVIRALVTAGFSVTRMASTGGFLRRGNVTLLVGIEPEQVEAVMAVIKNHCHAADLGHHAATIFILDMPFFDKV